MQKSMLKKDTFVQNSFNMRLHDKGANRDQIKIINDYVSDLVRFVDINKQDDNVDKFNLMKKVEIILHNLHEKRTVFKYFSPKDMVDSEKQILSKTQKAQKEKVKAEQEKNEAIEREERARKIKERLDKPKKTGKIDAKRSAKPNL